MKSGVSGFSATDLARLNKGSLERSFVPQLDIDWTQSTTDDEYESLYFAWALLIGSGRDTRLSREGRTTYVKYQQATLMRFTALLERYGLEGIGRVYDLKGGDALTEYVGHFMKEEIYHYSMFMRAIDAILASLPPGAAPPPARPFELFLRFVFFWIGWFPSERVRLCMLFTLFRFAEQVTIYAHDTVRKTVPRRESLIAQVWSKHALDEARHLNFDDMVIRRMRSRGLWRRFPELLVLPVCVVASALLNANEVWAARQLGVHVSLWNLPSLMRRTRAPFKRRVFALVQRLWEGSAPNAEVTP